MLKNYFVVAFRSLRRRPLYSAINVFGLSVGMVACLLIGLYIHDELSHDAFHEHSDRIVAIGVESSFMSDRGRMASYMLGDVLQAEVPGVEMVVRTRGDAANAIVRYQTEDRVVEQRQDVLVADSTFFEVFSFPLVRGNPENVLRAPNQTVITKNMARTFFGSDNPVGRTITFYLEDTMLPGREAHTATVAGVVESPPSNSVFQFDMVVPASLVPVTNRANWGAFSWATYALLDRAVEVAAFTDRMQHAVAPHQKGNLMFASLELHAVPLPALYLSEYHESAGFRGERRYIYLFGSIALVILFIALINYVNLVTAQGQERAREVGVRKTLGAQRQQLALRFLSETALIGLVALGFALAIGSVVLPIFNELMNTDLSLTTAWTSLTLPTLGVFFLIVITAASFYPAFLLSRFRPSDVLRGYGAGVGGKGWLRRGLVVMQFAVSSGLILCAAIMYAQLQFMQTTNLGFEGERVLTVELSENDSQDAIKRLVQAVPGVEQATVAGAIPGQFRVGIGDQAKRISSAAHTEKEEVSFRAATVDADYIETMRLELLAGRSFREDRPSDRTQAYILNREAAELMGWTVQDAVGKPFTFARGKDAPEGKVVGIVKNFHVESLRDPIAPVVLQMEAARFSDTPMLAVRLAPGQISTAMDGIETIMRAQTSTFDYAFLDDAFDAQYRSEQRIARLFAVFASVALGIACLGLFGLATFAVEQRRKEIAIRKALGAFVVDIVRIVSKEFAILALVALVIGTPVTYWLMQQWLQDFAYRTASTPWMFGLTAVATLFVAIGSTTYHAVRAALADPTDALR